MVLIMYLKRGLKKQKSQNDFRLYIINKKNLNSFINLFIILFFNPFYPLNLFSNSLLIIFDYLEVFLKG